jgi:ATP-dependent RNA helicase RhlB
LTDDQAEQTTLARGRPFDEFDLPPPVMAGLGDLGFSRCTPIQEKVLPVALSGRDVAGQAQTGSGKTAAFLIPMFVRLLASERPAHGEPRALITAPTRELALQIAEQAGIIGGHTDLKLVSILGGIDYRGQADSLRAGCDVVVATPGRLIDYLKRGIFKPQRIETVVIDEADRLFDLGFVKDLRFILRRLPSYDKRQSMLFSATLSYRVMELTYEYMNLPERISIASDTKVVDEVEQVLFHVGHKEKLSLLLGLLDREDPERVLIFCNTRSGVDWLAAKLLGNGHAAKGITGQLDQRRRIGLMTRFKQGDLKILVATDVASRGIDVENVSHVINYDLPQDPEDYVHRIGRTARLGKEGKAVTLACEDYVLHLEPLEKFLGQAIPVEWAGDDLYLPDQAGPVSPRKRGAPPARRRKETAPPPRKGARGKRPPRRRNQPDDRS